MHTWTRAPTVPPVPRTTGGRRRTPRLVAALLLALATACGSVPNRYYFTLSYPLDADRVTASRPPIHPVRLRVRPFKIALPYDRPQIVYRQSPFEYQYYAYRFWAAKPQHMVRELVEAHLESKRLVADVSREYGDRMPDYELSAEVTAIEEYDSGDVWYGHLAMRFELIRFKDKLSIWHYGFDRKRKVFKKQPVYVVRSLSVVLEEELVRVTAELDAAISADRGVKPTLPMPAPVVDDLAPAEPAAGPAVIEPATPSVPGPAALPGRPAGTAPLPPDLIVPDEEGAPAGGRR